MSFSILHESLSTKPRSTGSFLEISAPTTMRFKDSNSHLGIIDERAINNLQYTRDESPAIPHSLYEISVFLKFLYSTFIVFDSLVLGTNFRFP